MANLGSSGWRRILQAILAVILALVVRYISSKSKSFALGEYLLDAEIAIAVLKNVPSRWGFGSQEDFQVVELPPPTDDPRDEAYEVHAAHGAVASEDADCSQLGVDILRMGGNAVDAAITTTLCMGLSSPFSSGIGGGGYMLLRTNETLGRTIEIDFREVSPLASSPSMYQWSRKDAYEGARALSIPGEIAGLWKAHQYANLDWEELVKPVAELAENGWRVSRELARRIRTVGGFMKDDAVWEEIFLPHGEFLVEGDWIRRRNLARTLKEIGSRGRDAFYEGGIMASMVKAIRDRGGIVTEEDFRQYRVRSQDAIEERYAGFRAFASHAPSAGPIILGLLKLLHKDDPHRVVEVLKFGYAARDLLADPEFLTQEENERIDTFRSGEVVGWMESRIDEVAHEQDYYNVTHFVRESFGTTHISIIDAFGGAVSLTSSVNMNFGSKIMDPESGVIFNGHQGDFAVPGHKSATGLPPPPLNFPAPGKRSLSALTPIIVDTDAGDTYVLGGSGGTTILPSVTQALLGLLRGEGASEAIERPRQHPRFDPPIVNIESGYPVENIDQLRAAGHNITFFDINVGLSQVQVAIRYANGRAAGY